MPSPADVVHIHGESIVVRIWYESPCLDCRGILVILSAFVALCLLAPSLNPHTAHLSVPQLSGPIAT